MSGIAQDVRSAIRGLGRRPGWTFIAVLTLAVGIGANTAVYTVADALMLRPPPFDHSERLYWIYDINEKLRLTVNNTVPPSPANFLDWREQNHSFEHMVAWRNWWFSVAGSSSGAITAEQVRGVTVSPRFFDMLGVQAAVGRTFRPEEEQPGRDRVVVLTHGFWIRRFGGDQSIVGRTLLVDGLPFTVIGVLPSDFYFLWPDSAVFMPLRVDADFRRGRSTHSVVVLARLAPGITRTEAQADLDRITGDLQRAYPETNDGWGAALQPIFPLNKNLRPAFTLLLAAVACVLLIACINVASLLLIRASGRQREMAIRTAIGASRLRLIRQMFTESALLAVLGAACGVVLAMVGLRVLLPLIPQVQIARALTIVIDTRILVFTLMTTVFTTVVVGLLPALRASRTDRLRVSEQSGRHRTAGRIFVTAEIALSLMLLVGAIWFVQSLWNLQQVNPGFRPERLLTMQLWVPMEKYADSSSVSHFYEEVLRRLDQFPEVQAAAIVNTRPFLGWSLGARASVPGRTIREEPIVGCRVISPEYLVALGARLVRGRSFSDSDGPNSTGVALVNEALAHRFWPDQDPIGKHIQARSLGSTSSAPWWPDQMTDTFTIVGIVGNIKESQLRDHVEPVIYLSHRQNPSRYAHLLVRTESAPTNVSAIVQREIREVDRDLGVYGIRTMEDVLAEAVAEPKLSSALLWVFAIVALLLSAIGIYGVSSYAVTQRTREFAIRMAVGAQPTSIMLMVTRDGLTVAVTGIVFGLCGALFLGRYLSSLLYGVTPTDSETVIVAVCVVAIVTLLAYWRPAKRAARVDPLVALRYE